MYITNLICEGVRSKSSRDSSRCLMRMRSILMIMDPQSSSMLVTGRPASAVLLIV